MEGRDQKAAVSTTVSNKSGKVAVDVVPKASLPVYQSVKRSAGDSPIASHPDPTRFGDWEHAGRCIDF